MGFNLIDFPGLSLHAKHGIERGPSEKLSEKLSVQLFLLPAAASSFLVSHFPRIRNGIQTPRGKLGLTVLEPEVREQANAIPNIFAYKMENFKITLKYLTCSSPAMLLPLTGGL